MTTTFTPKQLANFKHYVRIQQSGMFNMFDPRARLMTTMDRDEFIFCMEHYNALEAATKEPTP